MISIKLVNLAFKIPVGHITSQLSVQRGHRVYEWMINLCEKANRKCCKCYIKRGKIEKIGAFDDVLGGDGGAYVEDGGER